MNPKSTTTRTQKTHITVSSDRLKAYVTFASPGIAADMTPEDLAVAIAAEGIRPPSADVLRSVIETAREPEGAGQAFPVVQGQPPVNGRDGYPVWHVEWDAAHSLEDGQQVDYREFRKILTVEPDQKILTIVDPTPGTPGVDVYGRDICALDGKPANIRPGKNVSLSDDGHAILADSAGLVTLAGGTLSVLSVYETAGNVDYETGNIRFNGNVIVAGDVLDLFEIEAEGDIQVWGVVEGARLRTAHNLVVRGGITGKEKGDVVVRGKILAKYLVNARLRCNEALVVETSIRNSDVKCNGCVTVRHGGIAGGSVIARDGIDTPVAGSHTGIRTVLTVGADLEAEKEARRLETEMRAAREQIAKIEDALGRFGASLETDVADRLRAAAAVLREKQDDLAEQRTQILEGTRNERRMRIMVNKRLHAGVEIRMGGYRRLFTRDVRGPIRVVVDKKHRRIATL